MARVCPVCGVHIEDDFQNHMGQHTKDEVVSALMRQQEVTFQSGPSNSASSSSSRTAFYSQGPENNSGLSDNPGSLARPLANQHPVQPDSGLLGYADNPNLQILAVSAPGPSNVLQQVNSASFESGQQSNPATLQIRKTLNNVNIVNNIGTNLSQTFQQPVTVAGAQGGAGSSTGGQVQLPLGSMVQFPAAPTMGLINPVTMMTGGNIMPFNMMTQGQLTSTPLLLPQVNGPTLLVNVPNYGMGYQQAVGIPGMQAVFIPGLVGQQMTTLTSLQGAQVMVPSPVMTTTTPSSLPTVVSTSSGPLSTSLPTSVATSCITSTQMNSIVREPKNENKSECLSEVPNIISPVPGPSGQHLKEEDKLLTEKDKGEEEMEVSDIEDEVSEDEFMTRTIEANQSNDDLFSDFLCSNQDEELVLEAKDEKDHKLNISGTEQMSSVPDLRGCPQSVISQHTSNSENIPRCQISNSNSQQVSAIRSPTTIQDSLLGSIHDEIGSHPVLPSASSAPVSSAPLSSAESSSMYNPDNSHLSPLNIHFPNPHFLDNHQTSPKPQNFSTSSVIVSPEPGVNILEPSSSSSTSAFPLITSPTSINFNGQHPITVDTVEALQSALACDNDVQLVVSNELLETPEFKALMQNMDQSSGIISAQPSMESTPVVSPIPCASYNHFQHDENINSETFTRPPEILEESNPPSPMPGSSRDISREGTRHEFDTSTDSLLPMSNHGSDDDITLQDLIAVETIDESQMAEDDDMLWSSQLSFDSFQYISNSLIGNSSLTLHCDRCGINSSSLVEHRNHTNQCNKSPVPIKNHRTSDSSKENVMKKFVSLTNSPNFITSEGNDLNKDHKVFTSQLKAEPGIWVHDEVINDLTSQKNNDLKPSDLKFEPSVATQHPLGAQNQHWKCGQCKQVYETGPGLLEHLDLVKRAKIKCVACHIVFEDRKDLIGHRRKEHPAELFRLKSDPEKDLKEEGEYVEEMDHLPNTNGEFVCDTCDRAFTNKDLLIKHLSCHIELKPHECLECGKKFTKLNLLREHRKRHFEDGNYQCSYCQKKFFTPNKLREHIRVHTGEAPLKCGICGKGFKRHSNLSEHKKIHEPNREVKPPKELFCHCGKVFKTQRDLDWHKEGEHEKIPKKCTYCLEVFVHSSSLTRHVRTKHENNFMPEGKKTNNYAHCPICTQVFYKTSINKHIRVKHQGQKPYKCEICKKEFVSKCNLLNHMWQHKNQRQRPFKCTLCKKAYLREALLEQHMRTHKGIKPHVCNECGLQFTNKSNWQRHVAEHTSTKTFVCPHCDKKFSRSYYLTDHLKVHTGEKPYICGICGKTAATRSNYNSHLRTHMTREPVNSEV